MSASSLKVFVSNDFSGHWPVGTSAIAVASDEFEACLLLSSKLLEHGLTFDGTVREVVVDVPCAEILQDGNY